VAFVISGVMTFVVSLKGAPAPSAVPQKRTAPGTGGDDSWEALFKQG
jgi:hypothetical protein